MKFYSIALILMSGTMFLPVSAQVKDTFTDNRDGKVYSSVKIGNQTWMAENLAYLPKIDQVEDGVFDFDRFWVYNYFGKSVDEAKKTTDYKNFGVLYNWPSALKVCPAGWHIPTDKEWKTMEEFLGMSAGQANSIKWRSSGDIGKKLKAVTGWHENSGTDEFGFSALPGGCRGYNGFESESYCGFFWTGSPTNGDNGWRRAICFDENGIEKNEDRRYFGCSVRCVKDE
jgi:uncharacterized protein (TIGR02145 family)